MPPKPLSESRPFCPAADAASPAPHPARRRLLEAGAAAAALAAMPAFPTVARAQAAGSRTTSPTAPAGYPAEYEGIVSRALHEGAVTVYASTDSDIVRPLIDGFEARFPGVRVNYRDLNTVELNDRFLAETAKLGGGRPARDADYADVLWSTAMDLQIKLVNDGYAQRYESPERGALPAWAVWRDEAWGTTFEPAVIVYNRRHFTDTRMPGSRSGLAQLMQEHAPLWRGRVVTYDIERSGIGYLFAQQDARMGNEFWYLAQALGRAGAKLSVSSVDMIERIARGEFVLGYNVLGSYALSLMERGAEIGVIAPRDYTLVMSRVAFIARKSPRPNAARLWLDFLISREGQALLARSTSQLYTIRSDITSGQTPGALAERLGYTLKPISVGPGLLAAQDALRKRAFLARWSEALRG
ncbi:ABC transporter substrate-binding protein [Cupriavidus sp. OTU4054]|uniref:ABC transporter substrate-binding protein n=1 Tax=unclassified Cupriavidus TaxID=2640874 RepID=UPI00406CD31F